MTRSATRVDSKTRPFFQYIIYFADVSTMHQSLKKAISDVFKKYAPFLVQSSSLTTS